MADLITEAFYTTRYGAGTSAQIAAFISDVSAEVVDYVDSLDNDTDDPITASAWTTVTAPTAIQSVVARVVNRSIGNPYGISQEGLGDHQRTFVSGAAGGTLAPKDKKIIRRAVGRLGVNMVQLEGYLPLDPVYLGADDLVL